MSINRLNTRHRPFARHVDSHQITDLKRYWVNQIYILAAPLREKMLAHFRLYQVPIWFSIYVSPSSVHQHYYAINFTTSRCWSDNSYRILFGSVSTSIICTPNHHSLMTHRSILVSIKRETGTNQSRLSK